MPKPGKAPAWPSYAGDIISDEMIRTAPLASIGAYWLLLNHQWLEGSIPENLSTIAALLGVPDDTDSSAINLPMANARGVAITELLKPILQKFQPHPDLPGRLINRRLFEIKLEQEERSAERAKSGKKGASKRWRSKKKGKNTADGSAIGSANGKAIAKEEERENEIEDHVSSPTCGKRKTPETAIAEFSLSPELRTWAVEHFPEFDVDYQFEAFADHARSHDRRQADWTAAFRNWLRKSREIAAEKKGNGNGQTRAYQTAPGNDAGINREGRGANGKDTPPYLRPTPGRIFGKRPERKGN